MFRAVDYHIPNTIIIMIGDEVLSWGYWRLQNWYCECQRPTLHVRDFKAQRCGEIGMGAYSAMGSPFCLGSHNEGFCEGRIGIGMCSVGRPIADVTGELRLACAHLPVREARPRSEWVFFLKYSIDHYSIWVPIVESQQFRKRHLSRETHYTTSWRS